MLLAAERFEAFGAQHFVLVGVFFAGAVALTLLGRAQRRAGTGHHFGRVLAVVIVCLAVPSQVYQLTPWDFSLGSSLPLQLCDFAWVAAAWGLWTRQRVPTALVYYWGLTLTIQAVFTPSLQEAFPDPRFFMFWSMHLLVVWAAIYLTFGLGLGPGWPEYRATLAVSLAWAGLAYAFDEAFGVNYGYLVHKPSSASLLDLLGPWPVYVVAALGILLAVWALMTWPWVVARRRGTVVPGEGRLVPRPGTDTGRSVA
jgi:hypothetical integral membrane protein (TIGR02206 family)